MPRWQALLGVASFVRWSGLCVAQLGKWDACFFDCEAKCSAHTRGLQIIPLCASKLRGKLARVLIRPVRLADAAEVAACVKSVYDEYGFTWDPSGYHADLYDLSEYVDPALASFWVAEVGNQILGCGGITWHEVVPGEVGQVVEFEGDPRIAGTSAELVRFYVRPDARRRGIGRSILDLSIAKARELARNQVEIWSDKRFTQAHQMYISTGAEIVGERVCPGDPDESVEFGLLLDLTKN